jgi:hypothetical protein
VATGEARSRAFPRSGARPAVDGGFCVEGRQGTIKIPRKRGKGLFVEESQLDGCDFFRAKYTGLTLCTDKAKNFIVERGYGNVDFLEYGDIIPAKKSIRR